MMDNTKELIGNFSAIVSELQNTVKELSDKFDSILQGADEAYKDWDHNKKKTEFAERNKDFLDKYTDSLKRIEGDDFDLVEETMKGIPEGADEAQYVAALAASIDEQLDNLRSALGVNNVTVQSDNDTTKVEAEGETIAEVNEAEPDTKSETNDAEEEVNSPDEIKSLEDELEKAR